MPGPLLLAPVRQTLDGTVVPDLRGAIAEGFAHHGRVIAPRMRVAITAGSRGIAGIVPITRAVVEEVRARGAEPFVVAAMGSHGGATAEGQRAVLTGYGLTEENLGCPIVSSMDTVLLGETDLGFSVYLDSAAAGADAIILVNRVKPHSILLGDQGSGLMKMAAIGLGKAIGADSIHRQGVARNLQAAAQMVLERAPIALGVGIVENALHGVRRIDVVPRNEIPEADVRLLREARSVLPTVPLDPLDVLIVDRIGKNISGTGMDPNVIGMNRRIGGPPQRSIGRIVALDLTDESHGNANGVGMADVISERLRTRIDLHATYTNAITADFLAGAKIPLTCPTGRDAVALACRPYSPAVRAVRIRDTGDLEVIWVSDALLVDVADNPTLEQIGPLAPHAFD